MLFRALIVSLGYLSSSDNSHTTSYNCCRMIMQDNVVQGSHGELGLPVVRLPNVRLATPGISSRKLSTIL